MISERQLTNSYISAVKILPENLRREALSIGEEKAGEAEEIHIRIGRGLMLRMPDGHEEMINKNGQTVMPNDLVRLVENATNTSLHSHIETIKKGFIAIRGGHRLGICGSTVIRDNEILTIKNFSSANLRIAKEKQGIADEISEFVVDHAGCVRSTLIISPPGAGKTTLLRDLIRKLSDSGRRMGVVDERGEIGGTYIGIPQFDLGKCTDILDNCPKGKGMENIIRVMSPDVIAVDEITSAEDIDAIENAMYCGVKIIATAHAQSAEDLRMRPVYARLMETGIFENIIRIENDRGKRKYIHEHESVCGGQC